MHNLQGVDCDLPRHRLTVITGPSGSGKSSLAFDTLYAEGQRRYVESLSPYARQFLEQLEKPEVEVVSGLSPAIAIDQRTNISHPRSTVGTVTEIYDHLRVLFSALGRAHCPRCAREIAAQTAEQMAVQLFQTAPGAPLAVLAPVVRGRKGAFRRELQDAAERGYVKARIDGRVVDLRQPQALDPRRNHHVDVLVDRLILREGAHKRLVQALDKALHLADGVALILQEGGRERLLSQRRACAQCSLSVPELTPRAFSFNSPYGACSDLRRPGRRMAGRSPPGHAGRGAVPARRRHPPLAAPRTAPRARGAPGGRPSATTSRSKSRCGRCRRRRGTCCCRATATAFRACCRASPDGWRTPSGSVGAIPRGPTAKRPKRSRISGPIWRPPSAPVARVPACAPRAWPCAWPATVCPTSFVFPSPRPGRCSTRSSFHPARRPWRRRCSKASASGCGLLDAVGVSYLSLDRTTTTLSGGEARRIRLAGQIGARMQGVLYVLDEPSVGLHPRDNERLLDTLRSIRDLGQHGGGGRTRRADDPRGGLPHRSRRGRRRPGRPPHVPGSRRLP